jgi:cation diffusion facilitator CzcD-associated flavoprotein CzcO
LTLSTVNRIHDLPGMPFPEALGTDSPEVRTSVAVPEYFAAYEKRFDLPVYRPVTVKVVCDRDDHLKVETSRIQISTRGLINATGTWESPYVPDVPGTKRFKAGNCTRRITARRRSSGGGCGRHWGWHLGNPVTQ